MVTKGYRKGVYERVTKGITSRTGWLGDARLYKEDRGASNTNALCGGECATV